MAADPTGDILPVLKGPQTLSLVSDDPLPDPMEESTRATGAETDGPTPTKVLLTARPQP